MIPISEEVLQQWIREGVFRRKGYPEFREDQPRDEGGKWTEEGHAPGGTEVEHDPGAAKPEPKPKPPSRRSGSGVTRERNGSYGGENDDGWYRAMTMHSPDWMREMKKNSLDPTDEELAAMKWWKHAYPHQCYAMAARFAMRYGEGATLVHGIYNPDGEEEGFWGHGWVELPGDRIFDGNIQQIFDKETYYRMQHAKPVRRYSTKAMFKLILRDNNFGPWERLTGAREQDPPHEIEPGENIPPKKKAVDEQSPWYSPPSPPLTDEELAEVRRLLAE